MEPITTVNSLHENLSIQATYHVTDSSDIKWLSRQQRKFV